MSFESEVRSPEDRIHQTPASSPSQTQGAFNWRDVLAKSALFFFGIALWSKGLSFYAYHLLILAWILDGSLARLRDMIKEPFVLATLILCIVVALGILWSDDLKSGFRIWRRYFAFLVFIPYLSLLNKERLSWAISGLLVGYFSVLLIGIYQWVIVGVQGIPPLHMAYLDFSLMLGIGAILALYIAGTSSNKKVRSLLWLLAVFLLFIQFNQHARAALYTTLFTIVPLIFMLYKTRIRTLLSVSATLIVVILVIAYSSENFQERLIQVRHDIELTQQKKYDTSLGYRFAIWDVGLHGITQRPIFGHGTGMAQSYFDETVLTYKGGLYKDLPKFVKATRDFHYHNDWVDIGMHVGAVGILAFAFLLWSWFQNLRAHQLTILGAILVCFVFLSGLTSLIVHETKILYLLLSITAIGITWQKENGLLVSRDKNQCSLR
ncbi:MAG: O-antigen ligase family protein [Nitrosospira sp.]